MFGALKRGRFRSLASLILVVNVVGELQQKRTLAASRGFLSAARLSCLLFVIRECYLRCAWQINRVEHGIMLPSVMAAYDKGNYTCIVQCRNATMRRTFMLDILGMSSACILLYICNPMKT